MPMYTFELRDGDCPVMDETGVWFADRERALEHAQEVAREFDVGPGAANPQLASRRLRGRDLRTPAPFASIDPTLDHLRPALRTVIVSCVCCESVWLVVQAASTETGNFPVGSWASCRGCEPHAPSAITATRPAAIEQLLGLHPLKTRPT